MEKKIVIFTHTQYSHLSNSLTLAKILSKENCEIYLYCSDYFKIYISEQKIENKNLKVRYYDDSIHKKISKIKKDYDKYIGGIGLERDISTLEKIKTEIHDMYEFILKVSNCYFENLLEDIKQIDPNLIIRDSCALFGRMIGEKLNIPIYGFATSTILTDDCKYITKKDFLELVYNINLNNYNNYQIDKLYNEIKDDYSKLSKKYNVSVFPINYLLNPGERINFCFGMPFLKKYPSNYIYLRPTFFKYQYDDYDNMFKNTVYVSAGSTLSFPARIYNSIINIASHSNDDYVISFKYIDVDFVCLRNIPSNVTIKQYVNQIDVLKRSKLFISHGGFNSLLESIYYEVPIFVIPICSDQFLNAYFVKKNNIGNSLSWHDISDSEKLNCKLKTINYKQAIANIKKIKKDIMSLPDIYYLVSIINKDIMENF